MTLGGSGARTTADTAYDPANDVYLVVTGSGPVLGVFVNALNQPVTGQFTIYNGVGGFGHFPRARYSPDVPNGIGGAGGFLVVWDNGNGSGANTIRGCLVAYAGGVPRVVSGVQQYSDLSRGSAFMENRPVLAYSRTSQRFLIAWTTEGAAASPAFSIQGRFATASGVPFGGVFVFEPNGSRDPALTWNPATDEFGLGNTGFNGTPYAQFHRIRAFDGATLTRSTFGFAPGTYATGIDVNSANQFVLTWGLAPGTRSATFDANGTMLAGPTPVGSTIGGDLSMGLAYNPVSNTFLAVSSSWLSNDVAAVEINPGGSPRTAVTEVTSGGSLAPRGSFYPLVTARTAANHWNVVHSRGYLSARNQIVASGGGGIVTPTGPAAAPGGCATADPFLAIGGGSCVNGGWVPRGVAPAPPPPPPPPPPPSAGCTMPDPFVAIGGGTCVNGGWIPRGAAPAPAPVPVPTPPLSSGCSTPDPFASIGGGTCVNGGWVPTVSLCGTPDPFVSIGGGICVNHGWIPRTGTGGTGCASADPFASLGGGTCVNGGWVPRRAMNLRQSPFSDPVSPAFINPTLRKDNVRRPPDGIAVPA